MANDTPAPDELDLSATMANEKEIAVWWGRVKLYHAAMRGLGRRVILRYHVDDKLYYLTSEEDK